jgi:LacI family transcriptional regulator
MARSKRRSKTKRIAIGISMEPCPHHLTIYKGILRYAATKEDWQTIVDPFLLGLSSRSGLREYDGVVGRITRKAGEEGRAAGIPVVNHWINSPGRNLPSVLADRRKTGLMAAQHLLARGFRRFGYVGSGRDRTTKLQLSGFEPPIRERGLPVDRFAVPMQCEANSPVFSKFYNRLKEWIARLTLPIAILVSQEEIALYMLQACRDLELRIPQEIGIMACRGNPMICLETNPTLSCVEDDDEKIGYRAAELLDKIMLGKTKPPKEPIWIEPKAARVYGSTDVFVSEDPLVSKALRFIADHAHQAITIEDVAEAADTSKGTLQLRFKRHLGWSVYSEIIRLRIETVKRILVDSDATLEEVASANGFSDVSHLVKSFRKATGITPGEFRKLNHT